MSKLDSVKLLANKALKPIALTLKARSPQILMVAGAGAVVASGVMLVRQTLKVEPILENHKADLDSIPRDSSEDTRKEVAQTYLHTAWRLTKHYGPAVTVGTAGLAMLLASNGILSKRNAGLVAAYKAVESSFSEYRKRVKEAIGEEVEQDIYRGFKEEEVQDEETGEIRRVTHVDPNGFSIYSKFFDEYSPYWNKTPELNLMFLRSKQSWFNDLLKARGYVFLNEVYKELGIPETQAGQVVGWTLGRDSDNYIDFNIYDFNSEEARAFVNGLERSIRLDFNVDGIVLDVVPES